ncbi:MAG: carbohydrate porin [Phycisphaerales bacterium]|nr:carbohydrate porin [Phycisphaerales bacterium]
MRRADPAMQILLRVALCGAIVMCLCQQSMGQEPDWSPTLSSVEVEAGPIDSPGRKPAPRTAEESKQPSAVQTGAQPTPPPAPRDWFGEGGKPWWEWSRATGDWGGARTALEDAGLTIAGSFTLDWSSVWSGGAENRAYTRRWLDLNATLDLDKAFGWKGGSVYIDFYHYGGEIGNPVGDAQGTDALITPRHLDQVAELWFQQTLFDGKLRVKAGKIDANIDFAFIPCATGFISYNGTWDPNQLGQPTYPDPATGVLAFVYPTDQLYVGFGVFDGATQDGIRTGSRGPSTFFSDSKSDSWYFIGEVGLTWKELGSLGAGQLSAGGWGHTGDFARFSGGAKEGTAGGYVLFQQQFIGREGEGNESKGLFGFARFNHASDDVALITNHIAAGAVLKGTFAGRDADECGVMWSMGDLSNKSGADGDEHNVELFYKLQLFGSVSIIPDLQFISNPSGNASLDDAWVGTLSIVVSF